MFRLFEKALDPTELPAQSQPPAGLIAFYWHFARQAKGLFAALFVAGLVVALLDSTIPVFMGRIVTLVTSSQPKTLWTDNWPMLLGMAALTILTVSDHIKTGAQTTSEEREKTFGDMVEIALTAIIKDQTP